MILKTIQKTYVQKSRIFLYPLLGIRRGVSITPIQTYMTLNKLYSTDDCKLIAVYHKRDDNAFKNFENNYLIGNHLFDNSYEISDNKVIYVFDFSRLKSDYIKITKGKYSKLDDKYKNRILDFYKNHTVIRSYLHPTSYMKDASVLYNVSVNLLKEVGELCSLPDLSQENLKISEKVLSLNF